MNYNYEIQKKALEVAEGLRKLVPEFYYGFLMRASNIKPGICFRGNHIYTEITITQMGTLHMCNALHLHVEKDKLLFYVIWQKNNDEWLSREDCNQLVDYLQNVLGIECETKRYSKDEVQDWWTRSLTLDEAAAICKHVYDVFGDCVYELHPLIELIQTGVTTGGSMLKRIRRICNMRKVFKQNRDSILVAFGPDAAFFAVIAKWGLSMKLIASERNDPSLFGNGTVRKFAYPRSDRIVFQTEDAKNYFPQKIQRKSEIIANPISDNLIEPYEGIRKKTVVCVGRLEKQKNHHMMIQAFAGFTKKYPEYTLHLFGKGSLQEELEQFSIQLGISKKVIFEGFRSDVLSQIRDAGMYILSSDYEGISNALLEAMALGLPVISTDCPIGGSRMCIENEKNGLLVPVKNVNDLTRAMRRLSDDSEFAQRLGEEAINIREKFSESTVTDSWKEVLNEYTVSKSK